MGRSLLIALAVTVAVWGLLVIVLVAVGLRARASELAVLLPNLVLLFRGLLHDSRVSRGNKAWIWFALVWTLSPIDLVPEFIPVAGPLDDVIVAALVLRHVLRRADREVVATHWRGEPSTLDAILTAGRRTSTPPG
jgi:uncharacterized membrane protein YkvA (DUF1232 family)